MSTLKKKRKIGIIILQIFIILIVSIVSYATGALLGADEVNYNKTGNTITVEEALNELYQLANSGGSGGGSGNSGGGSGNINYGEGKTASTVEQRDTIEITFTEGNETYTEQFMVLSNDTANRKIMAIPYYNLVLATDMQATASNYSSAGTVAFSSSNYWQKAGINIDMSGANNVRDHINAYNTKISTATGGAATAQIGRYYNGTNNAEADWNISSYTSSSVNLLNPSGRGRFWLGSSYSGKNSNFVRDVEEGGYSVGLDFSNGNGVRPVIKITYSAT